MDSQRDSKLICLVELISIDSNLLTNKWGYLVLENPLLLVLKSQSAWELIQLMPVAQTSNCNSLQFGETEHLSFWPI